MNTRNHTASQVAVALIIAVAIGIIWVAIGGMGQSQLEYAHRIKTGARIESLRVLYDGTPIIESQPLDYRPENITYRTLDGKNLQRPGVAPPYANGSHFFASSELPFFIRTDWNQRVNGISDSQRPGVNWYLVRPHDPPAAGYLVGFEAHSHHRVGFIGKSGFREGVPPAEEWFQMPALPSGAAVSEGFNLPPQNLYLTTQSGVHPVNAAQVWQVFLLDGDRLVEVDLRTRGVRTLHELPGITSLELIWQHVVRLATDGETTPGQQAPILNQLLQPGDIRLIPEIAVRSQDRVVVINPATGNKREFTLPEKMRGGDLSVYLIPDDKLVATWQATTADGGRPVDIAWLTTDGRVEREETTRLQSLTSYSQRQTPVAVVVAAPAPLLWLLMLLFALPNNATIAAQSNGYGQALQLAFIDAWPALLVVMLLGIAVAILTFYLQQQFRRPATWTWCLFVFALGVPGLIAYLIEHRRGKLESCPTCRATVPRDRDACADCQTPFAPPRLTGIEIFA